MARNKKAGREARLMEERMLKIIDGDVVRSVSRDKLLELVQQIPSDTFIWPNGVGNLSIYRGDPTDPDTWDFLGWVDIPGECLDGPAFYDALTSASP